MTATVCPLPSAAAKIVWFKIYDEELSKLCQRHQMFFGVSLSTLNQPSSDVFEIFRMNLLNY
jgi:hypothetical protein